MKPLQLLLAEDNRADVFLVREALATHSLTYELVVAPDGEQAMRLIEQIGTERACPDVLLLDLNLPKADGEEVLRSFREHPECGNTPVIVVTSSDALKDRERMALLGAAHYFRKPSDVEEYMLLGALVRDVAQGRAD